MCIRDRACVAAAIVGGFAGIRGTAAGEAGAAGEEQGQDGEGEARGGGWGGHGQQAPGGQEDAGRTRRLALTCLLYTSQDLTTARITLVTEEGTPNEKQETFLVPMRKPGELTLVKRFSYP